MMMEVIDSTNMSVLTRATWHNFPEDGILHSHCHENPSKLTESRVNFLEIAVFV
jgi:hypothetical protein